MSLKATAAIVLATVGIASTLGHAALPPKDLGTPAGQQKELHRQMSQLKQREIAERREAARRLGTRSRRTATAPRSSERPKSSSALY